MSPNPARTTVPLGERCYVGTDGWLWRLSHVERQGEEPTAVLVRVADGREVAVFVPVRQLRQEIDPPPPS